MSRGGSNTTLISPSLDRGAMIYNNVGCVLEVFSLSSSWPLLRDQMLWLHSPSSRRSILWIEMPLRYFRKIKQEKGCTAMILRTPIITTTQHNPPWIWPRDHHNLIAKSNPSNSKLTSRHAIEGQAFCFSPLEFRRATLDNSYIHRNLNSILSGHLIYFWTNQRILMPFIIFVFKSI